MITKGVRTKEEHKIKSNKCFYYIININDDTLLLELSSRANVNNKLHAILKFPLQLVAKVVSFVAAAF